MTKRIKGKLIIPVSGVVSPAGPKRAPRNPRTLSQQTQRSFLAATAAHWRELTDPARGSWCSLARQVHGQLSGFALYMKVNVARVRCGLPAAEEAPVMPVFGLLTCAGLAADDTPQVKLLQVRSTIAAERLVIEATRSLSAGIQNVERDYRELVIVPGPTPEPADLDLTAAYVARFGPPQPGRRIFVHLTEVSQGFKSVTQEWSALIANHAT